MLSPKLKETEDLLIDYYWESLKLKNYFSVCETLVIGKLANDPKWFQSLRVNIQKLKDLSFSFENELPSINTKIYGGFSNYQAIFQSVSTLAPRLKTVQQWVDMINVLIQTAEKSRALIIDAKKDYDSKIKLFNDMQVELDKNISVGWAELGVEEKVATDIASEIGALTQEFICYDDKYSTTAFRSGKSVIQTTGKLAYNIIASGTASVSFLTVAGAIFTVGYAYYKVYDTTKNITEIIDKIASLSFQASLNAQAMAATKAVLQIIYELEKKFLRLNDNIPLIKELWDEEIAKLVTLRNALESGSDPNLNIDIRKIPIAAETWKGIENLTHRITYEAPVIGKPITITLNK